MDSSIHEIQRAIEIVEKCIKKGEVQGCKVKEAIANTAHDIHEIFRCENALNFSKIRNTRFILCTPQKAMSQEVANMKHISNEDVSLLLRLIRKLTTQLHNQNTPAKNQTDLQIIP